MERPAPTQRTSRTHALIFLERPITAWCILALSLLVTAWAWFATSSFVHRRATERFHDRTADVANGIAKRMETYETVLRCGAGLFNAGGLIDRDGWKAFVDSTRIQELHPGIQGVGFSLLLEPGEVASHTLKVRAEGFPNYAIWPAGERTRYSSVVYLEPFDERNQRAFGYDMYTESVRLAAMDAARDSGSISVSGIVTLVQETSQGMQKGILMLMPVYRRGQPTLTVAERRQAIIGFVYSPFRVTDLMRGILGRQQADLGIAIYDGPAADERHLLYAEPLEAPFPGLKHTVPITIAGHQPWTLAFQAGPGFLDAADRHLPMLVATTGMVIDVLLFTVLFVLSQQAKRVRQLAERKAMELQESERRWSYAMTIIGDGLWDWDIAGKTIRFERRWKAMLGYTEAEIGDSPDEFTSRLHPDERERVLAEVACHIDGNSESYFAEHRLRRKDGSWIWVLCRGKALDRDGAGRARRLIGTTAEVTQRKLYEQALLDERQRLVNVLDGTRAGIWTWHIQTGDVVFNERWAEIVGYTLAELAPINSETWVRLAHPDDTKRSAELVKRHMTGELPYYDCESRMRHKDGRWIWVHDRGRIVSRSADGTPLVMSGTHLDISARKQAEAERELFHAQMRQREQDELMHVNRLAALGTMMAGLAHEFSHPAQMVQMNQECLQAVVDACVAVAKDRHGPAIGLMSWDEIATVAPAMLDDLRLSTSYLQALIADVQAYAHPGEGGHEAPDLATLSTVSASALRLVAAYAKRLQVTITTDLDNADPAAGGSTRLQQVVVNLLLNAIQASPAGGIVHLTCTLNDGNPCLTISDDGQGFAPGILSRLGQPFVATGKTASGGNGLGLSICLRLVTEHGGTLRFPPRQPHGTVATVCFAKEGTPCRRS